LLELFCFICIAEIGIGNDEEIGETWRIWGEKYV